MDSYCVIKLRDVLKRKGRLRPYLTELVERITKIVRGGIAYAYTDEFRELLVKKRIFGRRLGLIPALELLTEINNELKQYKDEDGNIVNMDNKMQGFGNDIYSTYGSMMNYVQEEQDLIEETKPTLQQIENRENVREEWEHNLENLQNLVKFVDKNLLRLLVLFKKIYQKGYLIPSLELRKSKRLEVKVAFILFLGENHYDNARDLLAKIRNQGLFRGVELTLLGELIELFERKSITELEKKVRTALFEKIFDEEERKRIVALVETLKPRAPPIAPRPIVPVARPKPPVPAKKPKFDPGDIVTYTKFQEEYGRFYISRIRGIGEREDGEIWYVIEDLKDKNQAEIPESLLEFILRPRELELTIWEPSPNAEFFIGKNVGRLVAKAEGYGSEIVNAEQLPDHIRLIWHIKQGEKKQQVGVGRFVDSYSTVGTNIDGTNVSFTAGHAILKVSLIEINSGEEFASTEIDIKLVGEKEVVRRPTPAVIGEEEKSKLISIWIRVITRERFAIEVKKLGYDFHTFRGKSEVSGEIIESENVWVISKSGINFVFPAWGLTPGNGIWLFYKNVAPSFAIRNIKRLAEAKFENGLWSLLGEVGEIKYGPQEEPIREPSPPTTTTEPQHPTTEDLRSQLHEDASWVEGNIKPRTRKGRFEFE